MAHITISTTLPPTQEETCINYIYMVCSTTPTLSPRSKKMIHFAYQRKHIVFASRNQEVIGWIMRIPFSNNVQELAAAFVKDEYRMQHIFQKLLAEACIHSPVSLLVTFSPELAHTLLSKYNFVETDLTGAIRLSRGKFLLSRLSLKRLFAIKKHYTQHTPHYLVFKNHE